MPSITCGHCSNTHSSVSEVRSCSGTSSVAVLDRPEPKSTGRRDFASLGWRELCSLVPAGRYAITYQGQTAFVKVDKPEEGRWLGYTFINRQAGAEYFPVRNSEARFGMLRSIVADGPREASIRYGKELGECGCCGRELTNPESIAAGIGPVCAKRHGW